MPAIVLQVKRTIFHAKISVTGRSLASGSGRFKSLVVNGRLESCQCRVASGIVIVHRMMNSADLCHAMHHLCGFGQVFANANVGHRSRDRFIQRPVSVRRIGLHVERVYMTGTAPLKQEDD